MANFSDLSKVMNGQILQPGGGSFNEGAAGAGGAQPLGGTSDWFAQWQYNPGSPNDPGNPAYYNTGINGGGNVHTAPAPVTGGAQGGGDWISQALQQAQSTDDPNYWRQVISQDPKVAAGDQSAIDYWKMRIAQGDGAAATRNGQQAAYGSNGGGISNGSLLASLPSQAQFEAMPGYQAALGAAQRGVERSAAAKGTLLSGGTMEDIDQRLSDIAAGNYLNFANLANNVKGQNFNQLYNLSSLGLNATNNANILGSSYANNSSNLYTNQGNANAAATISQGNNNAGVINSLGQLGGSLFKPKTPTTPSPYGPYAGGYQYPPLSGPVYNTNGTQVGNY